MASDKHQIDRRSARWDQHRKERYEELLAITRDAVNKYGKEISMDDIADEAQTSKSILYKYFGDKIGLQFAIGEATLKELLAKMSAAIQGAADRREVLYNAIDQVFLLIEKEPDLFRFMRVGIFESEELDPNADIFDLDSAVGDLLMQFLPESKNMKNHPYRKALARIWGTTTVFLVRGVADVWLQAREAVLRTNRHPNRTPDISDVVLGSLPRQLMTNLVVQTLESTLEAILDNILDAVDPESLDSEILDTIYERLLVLGS
ncbi:MAG: TetR/AcrR family transcriptional regulator [Trueperella sp.]|nr:TetR/AcrR family transcriptional regulator [Trueperella sp.]